ncbi:transmembrane protein 72 [Halyomorpha halys]|uniref:transmembrane protein 72 n=1 Tax=Halyomorpha halys TaxID=286706 RepID=UPI0006D4E63E
MRDMFSTAVYGVCEEQLAYEEGSVFWEYVKNFTRFWGVITAVVLCGVGVDIAAHHHTIGIYYVICSFVVFFLEITWIITLFVQLCIRNEFHPCLTCWSKVLWFRLWKRSLLYAIIALVLFLKPHRLWLSIASGVQLVILSSLYLMLTYRSRKKTKLIPSPRLLTHSQSPSQDDNDKYEDITDVLDDTLPSPILTGHMSELEQDNMLEI